MPSATNLLGQSVRRPVVTAGQTQLTQFDPILNDPGSRRTMVFNAGTPRAQAQTATRNGTQVRGTAATRVRTEGERGVALPRRDYRPVVVQAE